MAFSVRPHTIGGMSVYRGCEDVGVAPIAMFDSGEGGLTVLRQACSLYPGEHFLYAADSAHFPYGPKSLSQVREWFMSFVDFFLEKNAKAIIIACNTATAAALEAAQLRSPVPVIGVIYPGVQKALENSPKKRIAVLSTEATYRSGIYPRALKELYPGVQVVAAPCPVLVMMVEEGRTDGPEVTQAVRACTEPVLAQNVDTVILGCTHFPHMETIFRKVVNHRATIIDPGVATAEILPQWLGPLKSQGTGSIEFFTTGDPHRFARIAKILWPDFAGHPYSLQWHNNTLTVQQKMSPTPPVWPR